MVPQGLGFAIIAAACIVKTPQIWKIAASKSAVGLSLISFELEQLAMSVHVTYGYLLGIPFSAYGEGIVLLLQNVIILGQAYVFSKAPVWRPVLVMSLFGTAMACIGLGGSQACYSTHDVQFPSASGNGGDTEVRVQWGRVRDTSPDQGPIRPEQCHRLGSAPPADTPELQGAERAATVHNKGNDGIARSKETGL